jgi:hypothetical protein
VCSWNEEEGGREDLFMLCVADGDNCAMSGVTPSGINFYYVLVVL